MTMLTKGEVVTNAYSQLKISGLTSNPRPEELENALNRLESMMAEFNGRNICLDYAFEDVPDLATSTEVDVQFNQMMETNLATRLIPDFGKKAAQDDSLNELKKQATQSLSNASARSAMLNRGIYPRRQAVGSGNTFRWQRWRRFTQDADNAPIDCSTVQMPLNIVKTIDASWSDEIDTGVQVITSATITYSTGLTQQALSFDDDSVTFTVLSTLCGAQTATIEIVTDLTTPNNFDVRIIDFNIIDNNTLNN